MKDYVRNEKQNGQNYDLGRQNIKKINEINLKLETKMLFLAQLREIPEKKSEIIKLLDVLFDAKKLHQSLLGKMENLGELVE